MNKALPEWNSTAPGTRSQNLASVIKSARDLMRKDKGLSGDTDRLPMLTWIMFLKFLDDHERVREDEAMIAGDSFTSAIEFPYRWRDWAAAPDGMTGDELLAFITQDEAVRPDGTRGPGLFHYLKNLQGATSRDRRETISAVFRGTVNRMISGYLLRDVVNKIETIHFDSSEELHALSQTYETLLREMRDAAGDSGEFYTPRPVVRLMVELMNPKLGEVVLDPACGTGGFLVEAYEHLAEQCHSVKDRTVLERSSVQGCEAKPLPYLLANMNLLLHGMEAPEIDPGNALRHRLAEIGDEQRVDVILTNPPFGGEEERGILGNFPDDKQTSETTLLFLQLIMRKLRRNGAGRAAVVVPNGTLYASGVAARIREELLVGFNLHTVVRLPKGVFEPYADIPTNILFFDTSKPTGSVWFYEHPLPPHRARMKSPCYSKTDPLNFKEFEPLIAWWTNRKEDQNAWLESTLTLEAGGWSLDRKNPHPADLEHRSLSDLGSEAEDFTTFTTKTLKQLGTALTSVAELMEEVGSGREVNRGTLADFCQVIKGTFPTQKTSAGPYRFVVTAADARTADGWQLDTEAVCIPMVSSTGHGHAAIHRIHYAEGKFALANIMAAVVVKKGVKLLPKFLYYYLWFSKEEKLVSLMSGTANTSLTIGKLQGVEITFPDVDTQRAIVGALDLIIDSTNGVGDVIKGLIPFQENCVSQALKSLLTGY